MTKTLLIHPRVDYSKNYRTHWLPYSILTLGSELKGHNFSVDLIDEHYDSLTDIDYSRYQVVGISSMTGNQLGRSIEVAQHIRRNYPSIRLILGGPFPTMYEDKAYLCQDFDFVIFGQGELPLVRLLNYLAGNIPFEDVPAILDVKTGIRNNLTRPIKRDDLYPFDFSLLPIDRYVRDEPHIATRTINYISSQGCKFNCGFCSDTNIYLKRWVDIGNVRIVSDIEYLMDKHNINGIKFYDSNFFMNPKKTVDFSSLLLEKKIHIGWGGAVHPRTLLNYKHEELETIRKSGCSRVLIGLESSEQGVLDMVGKGLSRQDLEEVVLRCKRFDIHGSFTLIVGFPDVPKDHIEKTLDFGRWIRKTYSNCEVKTHIYYPFPKTRMYETALAKGFKEKETLSDFSKIDYYEKNTDFVDEETQTKVHQFNLEHSESVQF